ncbi:hypothetical protein H0X48_05540 [Candidatus Dependentiae bacterium]|nr:hypothetical protein [Candidatus Dependentiae bacterium]
MILKYKLNHITSLDESSYLLTLSQKITPTVENSAFLKDAVAVLYYKQAQLNAEQVDNQEALSSAIAYLEKTPPTNSHVYLKQAYTNLGLYLYKLNVPTANASALELCIKALALDVELKTVLKQPLYTLFIRAIGAASTLKEQAQIGAFTRIQGLIAKQQQLFEQEELKGLYDALAKAYVSLVDYHVQEYCAGHLYVESKRRQKAKSNNRVSVLKQIQEMLKIIATYGSVNTQADAYLCYSKILLHDKKHNELQELLGPLSTTSLQAKAILDQLAQENKNSEEQLVDLERALSEKLQLATVMQTQMEEVATVETFKKSKKAKKKRRKKNSPARESSTSHVEPMPDALDESYDTYFQAGINWVQKEIEDLKNSNDASSGNSNSNTQQSSFEQYSEKIYQEAMSLLEGTQGEQNVWAGIRMLKKALILGSAQAAYMLGSIYRENHTIWGLRKDIFVDPRNFGLDFYVLKTPLQFIERTPEYCKWYAARLVRSQQVKSGIEQAIDWSLHNLHVMDHASYANLIKDEKAFHAYKNGAAYAYFDFAKKLCGNATSSYYLNLLKEVEFYQNNAYTYRYDYSEDQEYELQREAALEQSNKDLLELEQDPVTQEVKQWLAKYQLETQ